MHSKNTYHKKICLIWLPFIICFITGLESTAQTESEGELNCGEIFSQARKNMCYIENENKILSFQLLPSYLNKTEAFVKRWGDKDQKACWEKVKLEAAEQMDKLRPYRQKEMIKKNHLTRCKEESVP